MRVVTALLAVVLISAGCHNNAIRERLRRRLPVIPP